MRERTLNRVMAAGVTIVDPASTYIDVDVEIGARHVDRAGLRDPGRDADRKRRPPQARLRDRVEPDRRRRRDRPERAPAARTARSATAARIGNFVEVKNSVLGPGVKADHLSYIGDADVGAQRELRLRLDRRELRRPGEAPHDGRRARLHRLQREPGRAGRRSRTDAFVAAGSTITTRRAARRARRRARAPAQRRGLGRAPAQAQGANERMTVSPESEPCAESSATSGRARTPSR